MVLALIWIPVILKRIPDSSDSSRQQAVGDTVAVIATQADSPKEPGLPVARARNLKVDRDRAVTVTGGHWHKATQAAGVRLSSAAARAWAHWLSQLSVRLRPPSAGEPESCDLAPPATAMAAGDADRDGVSRRRAEP